MSTERKKLKILVIVGPTATGKSDLAVSLAKLFNGEIISADSRQVYRGMDIGTGKITKAEMHGVTHHLLDVTDPKDRITVARYKNLAEQKIEEILARGHLPILVGGTGFYLEAVCEGVIGPDIPPNVPLREKLEKESTESLFARLQKLDPLRAKKIDPKNPHRLIRAIEIAEALGFVPPPKQGVNPYWEFLWVGLDLPNEELHAKIKARLEARMKKGMLAEASRLHEIRGVSWKRMDELGLEYRYLGKLLRKELTREEFMTVLEQKIWQYAKRQRTWFKRNKKIHWFEPSEHPQIENLARKFLIL